MIKGDVIYRLSNKLSGYAAYENNGVGSMRHDFVTEKEARDFIKEHSLTEETHTLIKITCNETPPKNDTLEMFIRYNNNKPAAIIFRSERDVHNNKMLMLQRR